MESIVKRKNHEIHIRLHRSPNKRKLEHSRRKNKNKNQTQHLESKNKNSVTTFVFFSKYLKNFQKNEKRSNPKPSCSLSFLFIGDPKYLSPNACR